MDDEGDGGIIDDEGRLFGYVNVVDALVVLLIVGVGIGGLVFVVSSGASTTSETTTHVTIDLGVQPEGIADAINENDTHQLARSSTLTITDVYRVPENDGTRTIVRAELTGPANENGMTFDGAPPQLGRTLSISTNRYNASGSIQSVGQDESLEIAEQSVILRADLSPSQAKSFTAGRQFRISDDRIATVEDVVKYDSDDGDQMRLYMQASIATHQRNGGSYYGGTFVQDGATLQLPLNGTGLSVTVDRTDTRLGRSETTALVTDTVTAEGAQSISEGDTYFVGEQQVATVESVAVYETDQPDQKEVYATLELETVSLGDRARFGSTILQQGTTVPFRTDEYELDATIQRLGSGIQLSETTVLARDTVSADDAESITVGNSYLVAGNTIAAVESVTRYGTGDPDRTEVYVGLTLETLGYSELPLFGSTFVREGATIPFSTDNYELAATVQRVGSTEQRGSPETRTATVAIQNVRPATADAINVGMADMRGGETIAEITAVQRENATVVLTSDDGQIYQREHPINQDVTITADLSVRETTTGVRFKGDSIQQGNQIRLDLGSVTVEGELLRLE